MHSPVKVLLAILLLSLITSPLYGQQKMSSSKASNLESRPKLVVGIVVDQMRYEYIPRFWSKFGDGGFKRLVSQGFSFTNNHYNYFPTYTGPGHAAIYTGTTPSVNGIVGNSWYERAGKYGMYVVSDTTMTTVGGEGETGRMSPANLLSTTVTDELKKSVAHSKVIAVSVKDRAAVLPAGHLADDAFWYDDASGNFVSSTWYSENLPPWVDAFNEKDWPQKYSLQTWKPLLEMNQYGESNTDDTPYEGRFRGEDAPVFPHKMDSSLSRIKTSPFGNTLVAEMAKAAIKGEHLGSDAITDFLAISFSSTDYVGHRFGPNSIEVEDTYLRLDKDIAGLLSYLDENVGKGNYMLFLTADHGVMDVPASLEDRGLPGGRFDSRSAIDSLQSYLQSKYGDGHWIETYKNQQIYLNRSFIQNQGKSLEILQHDAAQFLLQFKGVASTNTAYNFETEKYTEGIQAFYQRGYYSKRSGDVFIQLGPGWLDTSSEVGSSHGSPYSYDTHVPLLFYGWHIPQGHSSRKTAITQIAPTVSSLLNITFPSGSADNVLQFK